MYNLRKVFTLIFFAIQMGVCEYALYELATTIPNNAPLNGGIPFNQGWEALSLISGIGTFIWFVLVIAIGGRDYQGKNKW